MYNAIHKIGKTIVILSARMKNTSPCENMIIGYASITSEMMIMIKTGLRISRSASMGRIG